MVGEICTFELGDVLQRDACSPVRRSLENGQHLASRSRVKFTLMIVKASLSSSSFLVFHAVPPKVLRSLTLAFPLRMSFGTDIDAFLEDIGNGVVVKREEVGLGNSDDEGKMGVESKKECSGTPSDL